MKTNCVAWVCVVLGLVAQRGDAAATTRPAVDAGRLRQIDEAVEQAIRKEEIPGAVVLIGRSRENVYEKAYGFRAVRPNPVPMTLDTVFDLASLSKSVGCAPSIMRLVEQGKIHLYEPVATYLPAFAANGKDQITVEQLLLHQGGLIPDNAMSDYANGAGPALEKVLALRPLREPGRSFWYSDVGYIVLGEVVRAVSGRPLDRFAREEIFEPAGMRETTYNPPEALRARCAPTQQREGRWMIGEVHDPRAYALGGVAGHAGVFSTARDLARFCRIFLNRGEIDGKRILRAATVREMIQPRCLPDGTNWRTYGFDVDTGYSSTRGDRFDPRFTFGHTGFTGTMFWIDPGNDLFVILLTHRVHPDGKGAVGELRRRIATLAAEAVLGPMPPRAGASVAAALRPAVVRTAVGEPDEVLCGIDVLKREGFKSLESRRIALVTNHTGLDREGKRTVDLLAKAGNCTLVCLLSPEHGLYGLLDEKVTDTTDPETGLKVYSLYGATRRPTDAMLEGVDTLVFDIQDVGARFYTYISTLGYCMEAAAKRNVRVVVLDRPNPITGHLVDGPAADSASLSFTAYAPIPIAHGMTLGELARYYNAERGIGCELRVVEMEGWKRSMWFDETGLRWVNPSPNMRNLAQATLYTGVCLLETTNVSVGRGTDQPFEVFGAPWIDGRKLASALNSARLPGLRFIPIEFTPKSSKFANQACGGVYIIVTDRNAVEPVRAGLAMAWHLRRLFGDAFEFDRVNRLLNSEATMKALAGARNPSTVPAIWAPALESFKQSREKYLIYR